jgi:hypothetical protein
MRVPRDAALWMCKESAESTTAYRLAGVQRGLPLVAGFTPALCVHPSPHPSPSHNSARDSTHIY